MHALVELARKSVEEYIRYGKVINPPESLPEDMQEKSGVFVCIKTGSRLRGCVGTFMPCTDNVAMETIRNAISASTHDSRFQPVSKEELDQLVYSVDVLTPPEKVTDKEKELDPKKYGIIISSGMRKGLLLPDLEGVDTISEQIRITKLKAGIGENEPYEIFRFEVRRYT